MTQRQHKSLHAFCIRDARTRFVDRGGKGAPSAADLLGSGSQNHSGWKSPLRPPSPTPAHPTVPTDTALSATSPWVWNTTRTVPPALPGQLCHRSTAPSEKKPSPIPNLNPPQHNVRPSPLILSLFPASRGRPHLTTTSLQGPQGAMRSPQSLFSTLNHPSALSRSHSAVLRPAQLRCPSLDTLRGLNAVFAVRDPALSTALQRENLLPCSLTLPIQTQSPRQHGQPQLKADGAGQTLQHRTQLWSLRVPPAGQGPALGDLTAPCSHDGPVWEPPC